MPQHLSSSIELSTPSHHPKNTHTPAILKLHVVTNKTKTYTTPTLLVAPNISMILKKRMTTMTCWKHSLIRKLFLWWTIYNKIIAKHLEEDWHKQHHLTMHHNLSKTMEFTSHLASHAMVCYFTNFPPFL